MTTEIHDAGFAAIPMVVTDGDVLLVRYRVDITADIQVTDGMLRSNGTAALARLLDPIAVSMLKNAMRRTAEGGPLKVNHTYFRDDLKKYKKKK